MNFEKLRSNIVGNKISPYEIAYLLWRATYTKDKVQVDLEPDERLDHDQMIVHGTYDNDVDIIEVHLAVNPFTKVLEMDNEGFDILAFKVEQTIYHEKIHRYQYDQRDGAPGTQYISNNADPQIKKTEEYLGSPDEIDARAHDIYLDITRNKCYDILRNPKKVRPDQSDSLFTYMVVFGFDTEHPVIRRLLKRTYQWSTKNELS